MYAQLNSYAVTDVGCSRPENEDQYLLSSLNDPNIGDVGTTGDEDALKARGALLLAVADGLGGHNGGAVASQLAVESLGCYVQIHEYRVRNAAKSKALEEFLRGAFLTAENHIRTVASNHPVRRGMATTLTAAIIQYPHLAIAHAGDSRCYHYTNRKLRRLTNDHTLAELCRDESDQSRSISYGSRTQHILWNCLGGRDEKTEVETTSATLQSDDWVVLATDGLTKYVPDDELESEIEKARDPRSLCTRLKSIAIDRGGNDNITIVACNWSVLPARRIISEGNWFSRALAGAMTGSQS